MPGFNLLYILLILSDGFIIFYDFRIPNDDLILDAQAVLKRHRGQVLSSSSTILFKDNSDKFGTGSDQVNKESIYSHVLNSYKSSSDMSQVETIVTAMQEFASTSDAVVPRQQARKSLMPGGVPLLDLARAQSAKPDAWKFPSSAKLEEWRGRRGYSTDDVDSLDAREICAGTTPAEEILSCKEWLRSKLVEEDRIFPTAMLPASIMMTKISLHDLIEISCSSESSFTLHWNLDEDSEQMARLNELKQDSLPPNDWVKVPVKLAVGNGVSWLLVVSLDISNFQGERKFVKHSPQTELTDLLNDLDPLVGFDVRDDINLVERFFPRLGVGKVALGRFVELDTLMILAGSLHREKSRISLSYLMLGVPALKFTSRCSQSWCRSYAELPHFLKAQVVADLKLLYLSTRLLVLSLRDEIIPDPDLMCYLTNSRQVDVLHWWARWIVMTLSGVLTHEPSFQQAMTRRDGLQSLRAVKKSGDLFDSPPYRIKLMLKLTERTTTLAAGGPRFLHVERERILKACQIFKSEKISGFADFFEKEMTPDVLLYARFGQLNVADLDETRGVQAEEETMLVYHPDLGKAPVRLRPEDFTVERVMAALSGARRSATEALLEWGRLNPELVGRFFVACNNYPSLARRFKNLYEPLRVMVLRVADTHTVEVRSLEAAMLKRRDREVEQERVRNDNLRERLEQLEQERIRLIVDIERSDEHLRQLYLDVERSKDVDRSRWRGREAPRAVSPETGRRGASPNTRAAEQAGVLESELPPGRGSTRVAGGWWDDGEASGFGRKTPVVEGAELVRILDAVFASGTVMVVGESDSESSCSCCDDSMEG